MSETSDDEDAGEFLPVELIAWPRAEWVMPLRKSVTHAGITYDQLELREPTLSEFEQILAAPEERRRRFSISLIAKIPDAAAAALPVGDAVRAEAYLTSFFDIGQVIGVD